VLKPAGDRDALPRAQPVSLRVYDASGRLVRTLLSETRDEGRHEVVWDGTDDRGQRAASGSYLYRLQTPERSLTRKLTLVK